MRGTVERAGHSLVKVCSTGAEVQGRCNRVMEGLSLGLSIMAMLGRFTTRMGRRSIAGFVAICTTTGIDNKSSVTVVESTTEAVKRGVSARHRVRAVLTTGGLRFRVVDMVPFVVVLCVGVAFNRFLDILCNA